MSWDLLGHEWAENLLRQHITHGDVRHAYLFTGPPGIGRRSLALEFAKAINCQNPPSPGESCGVCRVCSQTSRLIQPDLTIVEPEGDNGMVKVDQIRGLQHSLALSPYEAKYRIALLLNFQRANPSAQNALLKTLEEAPKQVILLLTADSPDNLLPTIASRCEILRLRQISIETLENALRTRWNSSEEQARVTAHLSNGRTGLALEMLNNAELIEKRGMWVDEFLRLFPLNIRDRFAAVDNLSKNRDQLRSILQVWMSFSRDLLLVQNSQEDNLTNIDHIDELNKIAQTMNHSQVLMLMREIDRSMEQLEFNVNLRLLLDNLLLKIPRL